jgi:2-polyprenyl-6-methoxyphenol hydroxylase-like FAD-dependent oxidoreductase
MCQRGPQGSVRVYVMLSSPSATYLASEKLDTLPLQELKQKLVNGSAYFKDWAADLKAVILAASEVPEHYIQPKPLYMLPIGHTWNSKPGVTLMGDAAHLMTPFAGEGVNAAMLDAMELAEQMVNATSTKSDAAWGEITLKYEEGMFIRAQEKMRESYENLELIFAEDSPKGFVEMMKSHGPPLDMEA